MCFPMRLTGSKERTQLFGMDSAPLHHDHVTSAYCSCKGPQAGLLQCNFRTWQGRSYVGLAWVGLFSEVQRRCAPLAADAVNLPITRSRAMIPARGSLR